MYYIINIDIPILEVSKFGLTYIFVFNKNT